MEFCILLGLTRIRLTIFFTNLLKKLNLDINDSESRITAVICKDKLDVYKKDL